MSLYRMTHGYGKTAGNVRLNNGIGGILVFHFSFHLMLKHKTRAAKKKKNYTNIYLHIYKSYKFPGFPRDRASGRMLILYCILFKTSISYILFAFHILPVPLRKIHFSQDSKIHEVQVRKSYFVPFAAIE